MCITEKAGPRLQLLKERGWKTHFESISLPPGNNRPQQGRLIRNQGLASFQEYILTNAQDATTRHITGHLHHATSGSGTKTSQNHNTACQTPGKTQTTGTAQYTHSTLLKSSNQPMAAARRRQGQQFYAWHGTPSRRPPLTPASEVTQPQPPALPPEAWPCACNTDKARQPKRNKVFLNTTHS